MIFLPAVLSIAVMSAFIGLTWWKDRRRAQLQKLKERPLPMNAEELKICRRRGHSVPSLANRDKWAQCRWCGIWLREVLAKEEREDEPPEDEQDQMAKKFRDL